MAINTNVYGASADWYYPPAISAYETYYNNNIGLLSAFKATPPKGADFGGTEDSTKGSLDRGNTEGKTPLNSDIDNSIIAFGQHQNVSPFGRIEVVNITHDGNTPLLNTEFINKSAPINTFYSFFSCNTDDPAYARRHSWFNNKDYYDGYIWSPDATASDNINLKYYPITTYGVKSMLNVPMVLVYNGEIGGAQYGIWVTLDQWRDTYNTYNCYGIGLYTRIVKTISASSITYTAFNEQFNDARYISSCVYDTIDDFTDYSFLNNTQWRYTPSTILMIYNQWADSYNKTPESYRYYYPNMSAFNNCERVQYFQLFSQGGETLRVGYKLQYSLNNYNTIMQWAALFGLPFTPTTKVTFDTTFDDEDLYFPVIDDDGVLHGDYTHGTGNRTNPYNNISEIHDIDYKPTEPVDPNTYSNITGFNSISGGASMTKRYVLDKANVDKLADDLWTISTDLAQVQGSQDYEHFEAKVIDNFLVTNPIDCIVSLKRFPFDVPHTFSVSKELVKLGKNTATAEGYASYNVFNTVQFSGVQIYKRFGGCFLDYEPYTQYELYVPFCGTTNLQAADIVGHTLNVRLQIDLLTGTCTAYIMADSLVIETLTGNCACDLQITGTDTTYMNGAIVNSITNARNAKTQQEVAKLGVISPAGLFGAVMNPWKTAGEITTADTNRYQADYNLEHIQTPLHSMGTASALTGWYQEFNARLMIYYPEGDAIISSVPPKLADLTSYGHTTGFALVDNKTLGSYTGLTVCSDVDLSGISQATATEKQMIYSALTGGVYI